ncbi:MAG: chemotaxis protein methyltransferase CheR [Rhodospirillaceae bacterium]|jgi:chemotaxis protein methyltransferase CheR|nr:chemotaxis protein methyltransferase CheR [Rhodospirillaceae bacterium]
MPISREVRARASDLISRRLGLAFPPSREYDLDNGLRRATDESSLDSVEVFLDRLEHASWNDANWLRLARYLTIGETCFFRYATSFEAIEEHILSPLIARRRMEGDRRLRIWSVGCASGEEAYSLAILVRRLLPDCANWAVTILATDVSSAALDQARRAVYRPWALREAPAWFRDGYFLSQAQSGFEVVSQIRDMVSFRLNNLAADHALGDLAVTGGMDLILCRNVLMYLTPDAQRNAALRLGRSLLPGGWLLTSPAEASSELFRPLRPVILHGTMFFRAESAAHDKAVPPPAQLERDNFPAGAIGEQAGAPQDLPWPVDRTTEISVAPPTPHPSDAISSQGGSLDRARALADRGDLDAARRECELALALDWNSPDAYRLLAAICEEAGDVDAAITALRSAIYLSPEAVLCHFVLGRLLLGRGDVVDASRYLRAAARLLRNAPPDQVLADADGLSSRRLLETIEGQLEILEGRPVGAR